MPDDPNPPASPQKGRQPLQSRSRASLQRMITAARTLLTERGSDDFSLNDVSRIGKVSIGSIYFRFTGKEDLLRAVHRELMAELHAEQEAIVAAGRAVAADLPSLLAALIDDIAEFLRRRGPELRPMMACAGKDSVIAAVGKSSHGELQALFVSAVLDYRGVILHKDPALAAKVCFGMIYASIARELGFEAAHIAGDPDRWGDLQPALYGMCTAFLMAPIGTGYAEALAVSRSKPTACRKRNHPGR